MKIDANTSAEDVLSAVPPHEDDRWELKGADILESKPGSSPEIEIGKQASAFANSGGGFLVLGISKHRVLEPCRLMAKNTTMKDWLSVITEQSVEYPLRHFQVHQCSFSESPDKSIFVIEFGDSPAAPHQAKSPGDRRYYYRIDGHSKPAPHFHVELLRNRFTKCVLSITEAHLRLKSAFVTNGTLRMEMVLSVSVENISHQAATSWGVHIKTPSEDYRWMVGPAGEKHGVDTKFATTGVCLHSPSSALLSGEVVTLKLPIIAEDAHRVFPLSAAFLKLASSLALLLRPVSQNNAGEVFGFSAASHNPTMTDLIRDIESMAIS